MPVLMGGALIVQTITKKIEDAGEKRFAIVDRTPGQELFSAIEAAARKRNEKDIKDPETGKQHSPIFDVKRIEPSADTDEAIAQQRYELSERVHHNEYFGLLEIGPDVFSAAPSLPQSAASDPRQSYRSRAATPRVISACG